MRHFILLIVGLLLVSRPAVAEDPDIARRFVERGLTGTMVLSSLQTDQTFIHNLERAQQRLPCASTFKILNTLIALDRQVISGEDDVLQWDGRLHPFPSWNQDQTLTSAFRVSCVWCDQELARRVGAETDRTAIRQAAYGALREPFNLTEFWLDGSLRVSAIEQVEFLKNVRRQSLPFKPSAFDALRRIMLVEQTPAFTVRAKTG
nr:penicillin-binding transpeptidase domain-containing protein [Thiocystis minor]